jgi:hypothetical protein
MHVRSQKDYGSDQLSQLERRSTACYVELSLSHSLFGDNVINIAAVLVNVEFILYLARFALP